MMRSALPVRMNATAVGHAMPTGPRQVIRSIESNAYPHNALAAIISTATEHNATMSWRRRMTGTGWRFGVAGLQSGRLART